MVSALYSSVFAAAYGRTSIFEPDPSTGAMLPRRDGDSAGLAARARELRALGSVLAKCLFDGGKALGLPLEASASGPEGAGAPTAPRLHPFVFAFLLGRERELLTRSRRADYDWLMRCRRSHLQALRSGFVGGGLDKLLAEWTPAMLQRALEG